MSARAKHNFCRPLADDSLGRQELCNRCADGQGDRSGRQDLHAAAAPGLSGAARTSVK